MESDPWELPVRAVVSHPTWRLEREVWFSARAANTQALSHPLSPFEGFKAEPPPLHGADLPTTPTIPRNTAVVQYKAVMVTTQVQDDRVVQYALINDPPHNC